MIDWHSHILPEMDDGAQTSQIAFAMLDELENQGFCEVFATPHFIADAGEPVAEFLKRRKACYQALESHSLYPHIHLGAEVSLSADLLQVEDLDQLKMGNTSCILLEPPYEDWSEWVYQTIFHIQAKYQLKPVIAHVDRYFDIVSDKKKIFRLAKLGYILQFNTAVVQRNRFHAAYQLLKGHRQILLGTDAHNMASRPPRVEVKKLQRKMGAEPWNAIHRYSEILFCGG